MTPDAPQTAAKREDEEHVNVCFLQSSPVRRKQMASKGALWAAVLAQGFMSRKSAELN